MERLYWNNDWKFAETWEEAMKEAVYPENEMEDVRLPHTCKSFRIITLMSMRIRCCVGIADILWRRKRGREKCGTDL